MVSCATTYPQLDTALRFTEAYQQYEQAPIAIREAMCLKALYPAILAPIRADDLFAGRVDEPLVGFKHSWDTPRIGYYLLEERLRAELVRLNAPDPYPEKIEALINFWHGKTTLDRLERLDQPIFAPEVVEVVEMPGDSLGKRFAASYVGRMAEINLYFDQLLLLGIPGLRAGVYCQKELARQKKQDVSFYEGQLLCLELFVDICHFYAAQAVEMAQAADDTRRGQLEQMAIALEVITCQSPQTLYEAIQLFWLYAQVANLDNFGRMDVYLGDFYTRDLDSALCVGSGSPGAASRVVAHDRRTLPDIGAGDPGRLRPPQRTQRRPFCPGRAGGHPHRPRRWPNRVFALLSRPKSPGIYQGFGCDRCRRHISFALQR